ncbi:hypothetical protein O9992_29985 [Vibrio lentus]|nr:hypothetical protein [Vibrio lentus]
MFNVGKRGTLGCVQIGGDQVSHDGSAYSANYWNQNNNLSQFEGDYAQWEKLDAVAIWWYTKMKYQRVSLTAPTASDVIVEGDNVGLFSNSTGR